MARRTTFYLLLPLPLLACSSLLDASDTTFARAKQNADAATTSNRDAGDDDVSGASAFALRPDSAFTAFGVAVAMHGTAVAVAAPLEDLMPDGKLDDAGAVYLYDTRDASRPPFRLVAPNAGPNDGALPKESVPPAGIPPSAFPAFWLALDDRSVAVGVPGEDGVRDDAPESGVVYLYDRRALGDEPLYWKAPNPRAGDLFGMGLALSGPWLVVGAPGANEGNGAVFVYRRSEEDGSFGDPWVVNAPNPTPHDFFGVAVAIHGDRLVVGAPAEDGGGSGALGTDVPLHDDSSPDSGAAYVYTFDGSKWSLEQYLKPAVNKLEMGPAGAFGLSVAISERRIFVGAPNATTCGASDALGLARGAASIFEIDRWRSSCLSPQSRGAAVRFGWHVGTAGDDLLVGAPWDGSGSAKDPTDDSSPYSGAAYLYRSGAEARPAYLKAPVIRKFSVFGASFDASSGWLAAGAFLEPEAFPDGGAPVANPKLPGAVYVMPIPEAPE